MIEFKKWPKTPRLESDFTITEKIDGANMAVIIDEDGETIGAQSRNRLITPQDDTFGFAAWVRANKKDLLQLGPGHHFGEWAGQGIQRKYGGAPRQFFLFNVDRYGKTTPLPACCQLVPQISIDGSLSIVKCADAALDMLEKMGSLAFPGYDKPEGIIIRHNRSGQIFKAFTQWETV